MKIKEAEEIFGKQTVETVVQLVEVSDPDGVWSMFNDMGMDNEARCLEYIYFELD